MKKQTAIVIRILLALLFFIIAVTSKIYLGQLLESSSQILSASIQAAAFGVCFWVWWLTNRKIKRMERK